MTAGPILYILDRYPLRSERFIARELAALKNLGIPVLPVALDILPEDQWPSDPITKSLPIVPVPGMLNVTHDLRRAVRLAKHPLRTLKAEGRWLKNLTGFKPKRWGHLRQAYWLAHYAESNKVRIIHGSFASLPSTLACASAMLTGIPYTVSVHANDVFVDSPGLEYKLRNASAIFACNSAAFNKARQQVTDPDSVIRIRHPLPDTWLNLSDVEDKSNKSHEKDTESPVRFLFAARLVKKKGLDILLSAFTDAVESGADIYLDIAGDGPEKSLLDELPNIIRKRVAFHGWLDENAYRDTLTSIDALVVPSIQEENGDMDGIPNTILESFALGIPVIATTAGAISDVLTTEETGTVISGDNRQSLTNSLKKILMSFNRSDTKLKSMSKRAQDIVRKDFTADTALKPMIRKWSEII